MKPYGNDRKDNGNCEYGCCPTKYVKANFHRPGNVCSRAFRRGRKKARRESRELCSSDDGS